MGDVDYRPDLRGTGDLMRTPEMHVVVETIAREAIAFARSISPDAPPYGAGYVEKFEVTGATRKVDRLQGIRAVAELSNSADYAFAVEADHHVLSRTTDYIERG